MNAPYLLQRICFTKDTEKIKYDYMGSAEFEFGSIPDCWRRVCSKIESFRVMTVVDENGHNISASNGLRLQFIGDVETLGELQEKWISKLLKNEVHLKEHSELQEQFTGKNKYSNKPYWNSTFSHNGVIDIENDYVLIWGEKDANRMFEYIKTTIYSKFSEKSKI